MFTLRAHRVFALTVIVLSLATGTLQYFGTPINCWTPMEFTEAMTDYARSSCYFNPTYHTPIDSRHPTPIKSFFNYYKLTPFILAFFGVLYLGPEIITKFGAKLVLFNFRSLLEIARQSHKGSRESRKGAIEHLVVELQQRVADKVRRKKRTDFRRWVDKIMPSLPFYIQLQNLSSKLVFVLGAILPLIFLRNFLHLNSEFQDHIMVTNSNVSNQTIFPKEIYCEFTILRMQSILQFTLQCDLPANDMFEKISLFVCFLAIIVGTISISDVISCAIFSLCSPRDYPYIKRHMEVFTDINGGYDKEQLRDFFEKYLKSDVIYLLQLIGQNSSEYVVCQILARLWEGYVRSLFSDTTTEPSFQDDKKLQRFENM